MGIRKYKTKVNPLTGKVTVEPISATDNVPEGAQKVSGIYVEGGKLTIEYEEET
jgi:hypothetical protein